MPLVGRHQLFAGERQLNYRDQICGATLFADNDRGTNLEERGSLESIVRAGETGNNDVGSDGPIEDGPGVVSRAQIEIEQDE
jgi:hypothetical protein